MAARGTHLLLQDSTSAMHRVSPSDIPQLDMSRDVRYGHAASRDGAVLTLHASHRGLGGIPTMRFPFMSRYSSFPPPMRFPFMSRYSSVVLKQSSALESCAAPLSVILFRARLRERRTTLAGSSASAISLAPPSSMLQPLRSSSVRVALTARALQSLPMFFGLHTRVSDGNRHERKVTIRDAPYSAERITIERLDARIPPALAWPYFFISPAQSLVIHRKLREFALDVGLEGCDVLGNLSHFIFFVYSFFFPGSSRWARASLFLTPGPALGRSAGVRVVLWVRVWGSDFHLGV